jgi:hypothetical protein
MIGPSSKDSLSTGSFEWVELQPPKQVCSHFALGSTLMAHGAKDEKIPV